jgi:hypothetical protein
MAILQFAVSQSETMNLLPIPPFTPNTKFIFVYFSYYQRCLSAKTIHCVKIRSTSDVETSRVFEQCIDWQWKYEGSRSRFG